MYKVEIFDRAGSLVERHKGTLPYVVAKAKDAKQAGMKYVEVYDKDENEIDLSNPEGWEFAG